MDLPPPPAAWNPPPSAAPQAAPNTRKRPRSTSPAPRRHKVLASIPDGSVLAAQLEDPKQRVTALNSLLKVSSSHEANYALGADGERILAALVSIVYECLAWEPEKNDNKESNDANENDVDEPRFVASTAWSQPPNKDAAAWARHCEHRFALGNSGSLVVDDSYKDSCKLLDAILVILRNLSFVAANLRLMAYSKNVLSVLVGCLYERSSGSMVPGESDASAAGSSSRGNLCLCALQTLVHLAPYLDVTGQKLYCDQMFLDPSKLDERGLVPDGSVQYGQASMGMGWGGFHLAKRLDTKEDVVVDVEPRLILNLSGDFLVGAWSVFPALAKVLVDPQSPRSVVMVAVDLLKEFLDQASDSNPLSNDDEEQGKKSDNIPNASAIMVHIPDVVLDRLVDLLWIPRLGPDSLEYINPINNIVSRVSTLKLLMGYDATVDTDLRDRSLDVLVPLLDLKTSPELAKRLGLNKKKQTRTRLFDALLPILSTTVGRNDAPSLASELLGQLAKAKENRVGLLYVQERLLDLASRGDVRVAQLACNHLYNDDEAKKETN